MLVNGIHDGKHKYSPDHASAGFSDSSAHPYARFLVGGGNDIGATFLLRQTGEDGMWAVLSRAAASIEVGDITAPFVVDEGVGEFRYDGSGGPYYWNLCRGASEYSLYLSTKKNGNCISGVTLMAREFSGL